MGQLTTILGLPERLAWRLAADARKNGRSVNEQIRAELTANGVAEPEAVPRGRGYVRDEEHNRRDEVTRDRRKR